MADTVKCSKAWRNCAYACHGYEYSGRRKFVSCDYILKTGTRRGCNPEECDKFKLKKKEVK